MSDKKTVQASEQHREDVQVARTAWCQWQSQCDPSRLVFLDETGATTDMTPRYGRSLVGHRCEGRAPPLLLGSSQWGPTLRSNDIVACDNLCSHKVAGVQEIIEATGARLVYLPPYSPDFNPVEQVFAKLKTLLRKAMVKTYDQLGRRLEHYSTASRYMNAPITSRIQGMFSTKLKIL